MNTQPRQTSALAITSLVSGILGWTLVPWIGSIVAIVTGHLARGEIRREPERVDGDGLAIAGLVLGYAMLAFSVVVGAELSALAAGELPERGIVGWPLALLLLATAALVFATGCLDDPLEDRLLERHRREEDLVAGRGEVDAASDEGDGYDCEGGKDQRALAFRGAGFQICHLAGFKEKRRFVPDKRNYRSTAVKSIRWER